jgi:DNA ligase (NAD+)
VQSATLDQLLDVDGIGAVVAESILAWFADPDNTVLMEKFKELGVTPQYQKVSGKLTGKNFVVTGTLESMGRDIAADRIRALGGAFQTTVAKDTTYLVAGGGIGASKLEKAKKYAITVIDEKTFLEMLK